MVVKAGLRVARLELDDETNPALPKWWPVHRRWGEDVLRNEPNPAKMAAGARGRERGLLAKRSHDDRNRRGSNDCGIIAAESRPAGSERNEATIMRAKRIAAVSGTEMQDPDPRP